MFCKKCSCRLIGKLIRLNENSSKASYLLLELVVIITIKLHSTKPELRLGTGSNPLCGLSEIYGDESIWQWSRLKIRVDAFRR